MTTGSGILEEDDDLLGAIEMTKAQTDSPIEAVDAYNEIRETGEFSLEHHRAILAYNKKTAGMLNMIHKWIFMLTA